METCPGASEQARAFVSAFAELAERSGAGQKARAPAWSAMDANGNGYVSLAEADGFILKTLQAALGDGGGEDLFRLYRPAYLPAFNRVKNVAPDHAIQGMQATADDYVTKKEFRLMCSFLILYVQALDAFSAIDGGGAGVDENDDRRISTEEWAEHGAALADYGFVGLRAAAAGEGDAFDGMDADGRGMVLFGEWSDFLFEAEVRAKTPIGAALTPAIRSSPKRGYLRGTSSASKAAPKSSSRGPARTPSRDPGRDPGRTPKAKIQSRTPRATPGAAARTTPRTGPRSASSSASKATKSHQRRKNAASKANKAGPTDGLAQFVRTLQDLRLESALGRRERTAAFSSADPNGNGFLSLAEVDSWLSSTLISKHRKIRGGQLNRIYRPMYLHAFDAAKSIAPSVPLSPDKSAPQSGTADTDSFVTKREFRILISYLCIMAEMLDAFQTIDGGGAGVDENDDRRIEKVEWMSGADAVASYKLVGLRDIEDPEAVFTAMDTDGEGMVLLGEWIDYLAREEVKAKTRKGADLEKASTFRDGAESVAVTREPPQDRAAEGADAEEEEAEHLNHEEEEAEHLANEEEHERLAAEDEEAARLAAEEEEAARFAVEKEAARLAAELEEAWGVAAEKEEAARLAAEEQDELQRLEEEKRAAAVTAEEQSRLEAVEAAAIARLEAEAAEEERLAAEEAAEAAAIARLEAEAAEEERLAAEEAAEAAEIARLEAEAAEEERLAAEEAEEAAEIARLEVEASEAERLATELLARLEETGGKEEAKESSLMQRLKEQSGE